jgi:hypothetical protein
LIRFPSFFLLRPLLTSLLSIWVACHLVVAAVFSVTGGISQALWPGPSASVILVPLIPFLFFLDLRIKRLNVFLANLGISLRFLFVGALFFALGLEVLGTVIASLFLSGPALR